ncbi:MULTISPECIES: alkylmercury lyase family protein [Streptomyces]|uniref:Alkylmercury lyase n=3 Tax=Actinomycetes TaxID=1760 RepID=A0A1E7LTI5_9ACTN|nr:alkylmercury lyase family protein [Streptomyces nanshensis]OEV19461.1 alkylmercury lyase [Streptomyces nanshensis]
MRITVLTVPDCPNAPVVRERITAALGGRDARVELIEVREEAEAARWQMTGSPTVLVDGVDPFAVAGAPASVSCRLYRDEEGRPGGAPSVEALRQAFAGTGVSASAPVEECCRDDRDVLDPIGRAGRGRSAPDERGLRAVHQAVLRHFAATGHAPEPADLAAAAASAGRTAADVLAELACEDFLTLDAAGRISAAYPFCAVPTPHRLRLASGVEAWAMCAIDALGVAAMLHQDVTVSSCDPVDGRPITVAFTDGTAHWEPAEAVVFVGQRDQAGPAATVCCDALNFFAGPTTAEAWARQHPEVQGRVTSQAEALRIAEQTFGPLLARE